MRLAFFASVLAILAAGSAWAQSPPATPRPPDAPVVPAQPAPSPEDPARMAQARERFQSGMSHYDAHRYRDAIHDFELASSLVPSADIAYNIARCYEQLQELDPAIQYYERYLREKVEPPDRPEVEAKLAELRRTRELARQTRRQRAGYGLLRVTSREAATTVSVDGGSPAATPLERPLRVGPRSSLVAEAEGMQRFVARVGARPGEIATAVVDLEPATRYETRAAGRLWTWVVGGAAVVATGVGVAFGVAAYGRSNDAGRATGEEQLRLYDQAGDLANRADMSFAGALFLGLTSVVLYFVEGASSETRQIPPRRGLRGVVAPTPASALAPPPPAAQ
ncbi:MAG: tetratricopeptide repeat protein [Deltaproteobacteria bacterium]|nr:tetratricopeptide repeat protein [Deltaproteobacteria bacterium]